MIHPNDDTGDTLRRLEAQGDNLSRARDIDFSVVFPDSLGAGEFAEYFRKRGYRATIQHAQVREKHPWDEIVVKHMVPSHSSITDFERELQETAVTLSGYNDGWGCFSEEGGQGL